MLIASSLSVRGSLLNLSWLQLEIAPESGGHCLHWDHPIAVTHLFPKSCVCPMMIGKLQLVFDSDVI
jgi:hypothetical protein